MNVTKVAATALLITILCACSTTQTERVSDMNAFKGANIQEMRDILGAPTESKTMPNGHSRDMFVLSDRILRSSFRRCRSASISSRTNAIPSIPCEHQPPSFRSTNVTCTINAQYDSNGVISSVTEKPRRCAPLHQLTPVEADQV